MAVAALETCVSGVGGAKGHLEALLEVEEDVFGLDFIVKAPAVVAPVSVVKAGLTNFILILWWR